MSVLRPYGTTKPSVAKTVPVGNPKSGARLGMKEAATAKGSLQRRVACWTAAGSVQSRSRQIQAGMYRSGSEIVCMADYGPRGYRTGSMQGWQLK